MTNDPQSFYNVPPGFVFPPGFVHPEAVEVVSAQLKRLTFPGGFSCYAESVGEVALMYSEIMVGQEYFQHGLSVAGARCVFDVGANVGIFTSCVKLQAPGASVYAFEPILETFQILEQNISLNDFSDVHLYNVAVGSQDHTEKTFTFYPHMAGNSTAQPALKLARLPAMEQLFGKDVSAFLHQSELRLVQVRTLSSVIQEQGIASVDYLKIDVEGEELAVLEGIAEPHWPLIRQVAVEAHSDQLNEQVRQVLAQRGFETFTDLGIAAAGETSIVYARRSQ